MKKAFVELPTTTVRRCTRNYNKHLDELLHRILQQEQVDEDVYIDDIDDNDTGRSASEQKEIIFAHFRSFMERNNSKTHNGRNVEIGLRD